MIHQNSIVLQDIKIEKENGWRKIRYDYTAPDLFKKYIKGENYLFLEFPVGDTEEIPKAVLMIPFVGVMSTAAMLFGLEIQVPELDRVFFESLKNIEHVFNSIYHTDKIKINVSANSLVDCSYMPKGVKSLFFTGGVDATSALVSTISKKPILLNIWGGDLRLTDDASHKELDSYLYKLTSATGLHYNFIKTNAREMFDENALGEVCLRILERKYVHDWWSSIAHILSMVSSIAPFVYVKKIQTHYIGSSYKTSSETFDSNNVELVDVIKYCSCTFSMIDENLERSEKVKKIIQFRREFKVQKGKDIPLELKVCWNRSAGKNCCSCEKCYRTIMNIVVNHGNPNDYGFKVDKSLMLNMKKYLLTHKVNSAFWEPIQKEFYNDKEFWAKQEDVSWILHIKFNSIRVYIMRVLGIIVSLVNKKIKETSYVDYKKC